MLLSISADYNYDIYGNLEVDKHKKITKIKYNHLNLPVEINFGTDKIQYLYTSSGEKIQKKVTEKGVVTQTDYLGGFQYVKGKLSFLPTAEGFFNTETNTYVYQFKDHLGNVRLSYSDKNKDNNIEANEIIEETNYYPFGLAHKGYNQKNDALMKDYKYQYNGKEKQEELALNFYDYGARNYDAAIGRWMNVDPLAEKYPSWTPYHYVHNNPMNLIDPTGMEAEGGGWFSKAWSSIKNTFSSSSKTEDMTVLDEIMISVKGQTQEERVRDKQIDILSSEYKQQQQIQEWTELGIWDPNISYDNWGHAVGSQLGLVMPTARFGGLFGLFSKAPKGSLSIQQGGAFSSSEIAAAEYMQSLGNNVVLRSPVGTRAAGGTSDLIVNGINYDVYTPTTNNASRIISAIAKKNSQTTGVVLDLSQTSINANQLGNVLQRVQGTGANNIKNVVIMPK